MLVNTRIGLSEIHGTGLFATESIASGAVVWRFVPGEDGAYTKNEADTFPEPRRSEILGLYHSYISKQTDRYISCGDDAKYINHSDTPNLGTRFEVGVEEDINFALRDIAEGEELTIDYRTFAADVAEDVHFM